MISPDIGSPVQCPTMRESMTQRQFFNLATSGGTALLGCAFRHSSFNGVSLNSSVAI